MPLSLFSARKAFREIIEPRKLRFRSHTWLHVGKRVGSAAIDVSLWRARDAQVARDIAFGGVRQMNKPSLYTVLVICSILATLWLCLTIELRGGAGRGCQ